eukprot:9832114-Alexandrium_andersonii.AAC.1
MPHKCQPACHLARQRRTGANGRPRAQTPLAQPAGGVLHAGLKCWHARTDAASGCARRHLSAEVRDWPTPGPSSADTRKPDDPALYRCVHTVVQTQNSGVLAAGR